MVEFFDLGMSSACPISLKETLEALSLSTFTSSRFLIAFLEEAVEVEVEAAAAAEALGFDDEANAFFCLGGNISN